MHTAVLLLAAGASRRFGPRNKLLQPLEGKPLIRHAADAARAVPVGLHFAVISDPEVEALLPDFRRVRVDPGQPQSASLKAGLAVAQALLADSVLVVLADMPRATTALMQQVLQRGDRMPAAASDGQRVLPPAFFPESVFPAIAELTGDQGAGAILRHLPAGQRVLAEAGLLVDIDTPADLAALEAR